MGLMDLAGIIIRDTRKFIANPVDEKLFTRLTLLRKNYIVPVGILPIGVFGTKPTVAVSVRM